MAKRSAVRRILAVGGLGAAAVLVPSAGAVSGQAAGCAAPYLPIFGFDTEPSQANPPPLQTYPASPVVAPSLDGADLSVDFPFAPDMDGDGVADTIAGGGASLTITRGDGVLTLSQPGLALTTVGSLFAADLDADGHDEAYLEAVPSGSGDPRYFIVPGTTAVGSHVLADVAIEVPDGIVGAAGNQVGGPGDDLIARVGSGGALVSGDAVMAPGPGGILPAFVAASERLDPYGQVAGLLALDDGPPVIALARVDGDHTLVTLWDQGETTGYRTAGPATFLADPRVTAIESPSGPLLIASATSRSGGVSFVWNLDDPCAVLPAAAGGTTTTAPTGGTPTAPAAAPVSGAADYTG